MDRNDKRRIKRRLNAGLKLLFGNGTCGATPSPQRYPCPSFDMSCVFFIDWPSEVDDSYDLHGQLQHSFESEMTSLVFWPPRNIFEDEKKSLILPFVENKITIVVDTLYNKLGVEELKLKDFWLTIPSPPIFYCHADDCWDVEEDIIDNEYGRWMDEEEVQRFEEEAGRKPFSDEAWIVLKYGGINVELSGGVLSEESYRKHWVYPTNYSI